MTIPTRFKPYPSKPTTRYAIEVTQEDVESHIFHCSESCSCIYLDDYLDIEDGESASPVKFMHIIPVEVGDFIVLEREGNAYHYPRAIFLSAHVMEDEQ
ncbi:hypothetical protein [Vibrio coralliilyticus]|uniref:hypothetical protein n=1 Tax=Vibrio coralliilyticus TaxID=190893 RepID=UPI0017FB1E1D|nr:hypothetical protein [Vibrio coralliilyticus]NUW66923.1 hypothetical protein [Vibrio coralliilyticus]NUW70893.1 hypothetical protein [Vibrio coralliilyticus]